MIKLIGAVVLISATIGISVAGGVILVAALKRCLRAGRGWWPWRLFGGR